MFSSKRKPPPPAKPDRGGARSLANLGLMGMGDDSDDDAGDEDLEAQLNSLMSGGGKAKKPVKPKAPPVDLDRMVAACMEDFNSGDEDEGEDDADLLDELAELGGDDGEDVGAPGLTVPANAAQRQPSPVGCLDGGGCAGQDMLSTIESRIAMYAAAEQKAKASGDSAKARRFARGLGTLTDLRRKVKTGKAVNPDDIPPAIAVSAATTPSTPAGPPPQLPPMPPSEGPPPVRMAPLPPPPTRTAPPPPPPATYNPPTVAPTPSVTVTHSAQSDHPEIAQPLLVELRQKREFYKNFALTAKREGDKEQALAGLTGVKKCDELIKLATSGQPVSLDELPDLQPEVDRKPPIQQSTVQQSPNVVVMRQFSRDDPIQMPENPEDLPPPDPSVFGAPPPPANVEEALQQRLTKYREDEAKAKEEGNSSRARRLGRICQQYMDAIKLHKAGKPIPIDELPTPPGFAPIPDPRSAASAPVSPATRSQGSAQSSGSNLAAAAAAAGGRSPAASPQSAASSKSGSNAASPAEADKPKRRSMTQQEKQLAMLEERQAKFRAAAVEAKRNGQIELAKDYLRQVKGFDKLIEATKARLPVDLTSLPVPPQDVKDLNSGFVIVSRDDCNPPAAVSGDRQEIFSRLEKELIDQMKMCETNRLHFKTTGDIASANKFQQMSEHTKKDIEVLRNSFKRGDPVPKFRYEVRAFSRVVAHIDLTDNDLEVTIVSGVNLPGPKDMHTYCRLEFPYPKETPFKDRTPVVKDTNNPEFNHVILVPLNRKEKTCQRVFKRSTAKVEVWLKGGFLRSDTLIGSAQIKLLSLETSCDLHDSFPLMDGRKLVGGQVEVKMRLRNPILAKQTENVEEKWLVINF